MLQAVIGLEIHLALKTHSKLFCSCPADGFAAEPNTNICPICAGLPGNLPRVNRHAFELGARFALALGCTIPEHTQFFRKHYFYPDAPKSYQTSQHTNPLGEHGAVTLRSGRTIGITRCHVEEDAGRLVHPEYTDYSLVDLNRAGAPLLELVSEPELHTPEETREFLELIQAIARTTNISDAAPEEGKMRADVNISLHTPGTPFGAKVELKNLNSFTAAESAIAYEIARQTDLLAAGRTVVEETRGWNEGGQRTFSQRAKEAATDYRYFPDPDLPVIALGGAWLAEQQQAVPELPLAREARYINAGVREHEARMLAFDPPAANLFDATVSHYGGTPQHVANWLTGPLVALAREQHVHVAADTLTPEHLAQLLTLIDDGDISVTAARELLPAVFAGAEPRTVAEQRGVLQVTDDAQLTEWVAVALAENPELIERVKQNPNAINALVGQVMKLSRGSAKPDTVRTLLLQKLSE